MPEKIEGATPPQESDDRESDLFEQFKSMSIRELAQYAQGFNIFVSRRSGGKDTEGILAGFMDLEKSPQNVKVLVDGDFEYWPEGGTQFVRAENRKWEKA